MSSKIPSYRVNEKKILALLDEKFQDQNFVKYLLSKYQGQRLSDGTVLTREWILDRNNRFEAVHEMVKYYNLPLDILITRW